MNKKVRNIDADRGKQRKCKVERRSATQVLKKRV